MGQLDKAQVELSLRVAAQVVKHDLAVGRRREPARRSAQNPADSAHLRALTQLLAGERVKLQLLRAGEAGHAGRILRDCQDRRLGLLIGLHCRNQPVGLRTEPVDTPWLAPALRTPATLRSSFRSPAASAAEPGAGPNRSRRMISPVEWP